MLDWLVVCTENVLGDKGWLLIFWTSCSIHFEVVLEDVSLGQSVPKYFGDSEGAITETGQRRKESFLQSYLGHGCEEVFGLMHSQDDVLKFVRATTVMISIIHEKNKMSFDLTIDPEILCVHLA